jgi:hypothetical protein
VHREMPGGNSGGDGLNSVPAAGSRRKCAAWKPSASVSAQRAPTASCALSVGCSSGSELGCNRQTPAGEPEG